MENFVMKFTAFSLNKYSALAKQTVALMVIFSVCFVTMGTFSKVAHASIISSLISSLMGSESVSAKGLPFDTHQSSQTIALLQAANNFDPNPEKVGEVVPVAGSALIADLAMGNADSSSVALSNTEISTYVVQSGDTLSGIAQMFGVSVNTILWSNDITKASGIRPGQSLIILPVSGITHIVKSGETIKGITLQYKADLKEVLEYNELTLSSTLSVGQRIILPDVEITTSLPTRLVVGKTLSSGASNSAGYYIRPIKIGVRTQGVHGYNGVDLAAPVGTPIYASAEGTVIVSKNDGAYNGGYGNFIIIAHPNNTQTVYAHASKTLVKAGDYVEQGQKIALMGSTGKSTGSHVHFEIRGAKNPF
jgi:murein DD-endopeptidase MepM/ murein hydrolase activator NlpD